MTVNPRRYWSPKKGEGETLRWLKDHVGYRGEGCLIWPFFRDPGVGRGRVGYNGKIEWANRVMCKLVHGEPPTPRHHSAHSCGNGHNGCVHPMHVVWKTGSANALDRAVHGTNRSRGKRRSLTPEQVEEIRRLKGVKTQMELAAMYGVSDNAIRNIYAGRTWAPPKHKRENPLTWSEVYEILSLRSTGMLNREIGEKFDIAPSMVSMIVLGKWRPKTAA